MSPKRLWENSTLKGERKGKIERVILSPPLQFRSYLPCKWQPIGDQHTLFVTPSELAVTHGPLFMLSIIVLVMVGINSCSTIISNHNSFVLSDSSCQETNVIWYRNGLFYMPGDFGCNRYIAPISGSLSHAVCMRIEIHSERRESTRKKRF